MSYELQMNYLGICWTILSVYIYRSDIGLMNVHSVHLELSARQLCWNADRTILRGYDNILQFLSWIRSLLLPRELYPVWDDCSKALVSSKILTGKTVGSEHELHNLNPDLKLSYLNFNIPQNNFIFLAVRS